MGRALRLLKMPGGCKVLRVVRAGAVRSLHDAAKSFHQYTNSRGLVTLPETIVWPGLGESGLRSDDANERSLLARAPAGLGHHSEQFDGSARPPVGGEQEAVREAPEAILMHTTRCARRTRSWRGAGLAFAR